MLTIGHKFGSQDHRSADAFAGSGLHGWFVQAHPIQAHSLQFRLEFTGVKCLL